MKKSEKEIIQKLRDSTGAGVMEARHAVIEAKGSFEAALQILRERGLVKMEKRAGRETGAGLVHSYVHNGRIGVLLDIRAETDFVVRSEPFQKLAHELAMHIAASDPENAEELLGQPYVRDESKTVKEVIGEVIAKVGENISVNRFSRMEL